MGESWLATKDLKPTIPSSQGWVSSVHFSSITVTLFLYGLLFLMSVCVCMRCGCLLVSVYSQLCTAYTCA